MKYQEPVLEPVLRWFRLQRVSSHIPKMSILLDIGCGKSATFLRSISGHISQGFGVDFKVEHAKFNNIQTTQKRYYERKRLRKIFIEISGFEQFNHKYFQIWMNKFSTVIKGGY